MKILLAEDDVDSRTLLTDIIASGGLDMEFVVAENGAQAFAALEASPDVALAITDVGMPEMDGLQWLARVRGDARFARLPVILCTGSAERSTVAQAAALGISSYLVKPYTRSAVLEKVLQIVRPRRPAPAGIGDVEAVRSRLNIDRDAHRELLENLARLADFWAIDALRAQRFFHVRALAIRVGPLRQASVDLAATLLAERCQEAEELIAGVTAPPLPTEFSALLGKLGAAAKTLQAEIARLRAALSHGI